MTNQFLAASGSQIDFLCLFLFWRPWRLPLFGGVDENLSKLIPKWMIPEASKKPTQKTRRV